MGSAATITPGFRRAHDRARAVAGCRRTGGGGDVLRAPASRPSRAMIRPAISAIASRSRPRPAGRPRGAAWRRRWPTPASSGPEPSAARSSGISADPGGVHGSRVAGHRATADDARSPATGRTVPASTSRSSRWPLPATPATPSTSPRRTSSDRPSQRRPRARRARRAPPRRRDGRSPSTRTAPGRGRAEAGTDAVGVAHHLGRQRRHRRVPTPSCRADHHPAAQHRDAVGDRLDLAQLVGHEQHGETLFGQAADDGQHAVGLGRRQSTAVGSSSSSTRAPHAQRR